MKTFLLFAIMLLSSLKLDAQSVAVNENTGTVITFDTVKFETESNTYTFIGNVNFKSENTKIENAKTVIYDSVFSNFDLSPFLILVETTEDGVNLVCMEGCAFKELSFSLKNFVSQAIDQNGMCSADRKYAEKNAHSPQFLFTLIKTNEGIQLNGIEGTAWKELSFSCHGGMCHQFIDQNGMTDRE